MLYDTHELAAAVIFMDAEGRITKEMNIGEFQAVLDGYVPLVDLAGREAFAVYLEINHTLHVRRAVFFKCPILNTGEVVRSWHLPLMDLAANGVDSVDLGAGPIKLACCRYFAGPPQLRDHLWDPDLSQDSLIMRDISTAISRNRLGLQFRDADVPNNGSLSRQESAALEQELTTRIRREFDIEYSHYRMQLERECNERIAEQQREIEKYIALNHELTLAGEGREKKIDAMRTYFNQKIESAKALSADMASIERDTHAHQLVEQYDEQINDLKQNLQIREVEMLYMKEIEAQLREELARFNDEKRDQHNSDQDVIDQLAAKGIGFVCYQPALGQLSIPAADMLAYLENENQYLANKHRVDESQYCHWLEHINLPICKNSRDGEICGEQIDKVKSPVEFKAGESDCCHQCRKVVSLPNLRMANQ